MSGNEDDPGTGTSDDDAFAAVFETLDQLAASFDREGNRIDARRFFELKSDEDYFRVALTQVGAFEVSTVWLGQVLAGTTGTSPPLIFETLVSDGFGGSHIQKYHTEAEAVAGHAAVVAQLSAPAN